MNLKSVVSRIGIIAFLFAVCISLDSTSQTSFAAGLPPSSTNGISAPFPHIKTYMIDFMPGGWNGPVAKDPTILPFMASHYNFVLGNGENLAPYTPTPPVQYIYQNYYCMYVGGVEFLDAKAWAAAKGVDFESFFIHYAEPTLACYGSACYQLPAGSRVPTVGWYGTAGDPSKNGARVVMNPGNPNYRQWKLDYIDRQFKNNSNLSGIMVDNTHLARLGAALPTATSGGSIAEYPGTAAVAGVIYGNDLLQLFKEFHVKFRDNKGQIPNVSSYTDSQTRINLAYNNADSTGPYIKAVGREMILQPNRAQMLAGVANDIQASESKGVENLLGGGVFVGPRFTMTYLAEFYMVKTASTYFQPFLPYVADQWGVDPRINQWIPAIAYNVGQPKNDPAGAQKFKTYFAGLDPSSGAIEPMQVTSVTNSGGSYRLYDPTKNWTPEQWRGKFLLFPDGYSIYVYHNGTNWIDIWAPAKIPGTGAYQIGNRTYSVFGREFDNAIVLFKPLPTWDTKETGDPSITTHRLPALDDNPSGEYYVLNANGILGTTPITSVQLRNAEGVVLIKRPAVSY